MKSDREEITQTLGIILGACLLVYGGCHLASKKVDKYMNTTKICKTVTRTVTSIGTCTNPTSDAFYGKHCGQCRIEFDNGVRATVCAPVMVGDTYPEQHCKRVPIHKEKKDE